MVSTVTLTGDILLLAILKPITTGEFSCDFFALSNPTYVVLRLVIPLRKIGRIN